jgi:hypothetical protein
MIKTIMLTAMALGMGIGGQAAAQQVVPMEAIPPEQQSQGYSHQGGAFACILGVWADFTARLVDGNDYEIASSGYSKDMADRFVRVIDDGSIVKGIFLAPWQGTSGLEYRHSSGLTTIRVTRLDDVPAPGYCDPPL